MARSQCDPASLQAIVDMGSNGIRFSISSLQPPMARIMPTVYQHRAGISLYDAQYASDGQRQPIDDATIRAVILSFEHFKQTCSDFGVPQANITVLATEATRTAINSEAFRAKIKEIIGWEVTLMPKEIEGEVGALGIASSLPEVKGLVMDLGGGSTQLSWLVSNRGDATVRMPPKGAVSMPYGAAAMSRRLGEAEKNRTVDALRKETREALAAAYKSLNMPEELLRESKERGGLTLYLSGGGFRGWGYVLMSKHRVRPYPIPVINGFKAARSQFAGTEEVEKAAAAMLENEDDEIFRVSDRRASQVPAVAFLINALAEVLPQVKEVRFCQGGVREGHLFKTLSSDVQANHPLIVATTPFRLGLTKPLVQLLQSSLPPETENAEDNFRGVFTPDILESFANLMYYHATHSKDLQTSSAIRSTTSGILAGVHGVLHESRTLLALLLCARWGGDVPPTDLPFKTQLEQLVESPWTLWWISYLGAVAALITAIYPAGWTEDSGRSRLLLAAKWDENDKGKSLISINVDLPRIQSKDVFGKEIKDVERTGKRKHWIGGRDGIGHKVAVNVRWPVG